MTTQADQILKHLASGHSITTYQAFRLFLITRLPDRIRDLRKMGHVIQSQMVKVPSGKRVAQYWI